jgi:hypothetical protein
LQSRKYAVSSLFAQLRRCYNSAAPGNAIEYQLNRASLPVSPQALRLPVLQLALGLVAAAAVLAIQGSMAALSTLTGAAVIAAAQFVFAWRTGLRARTAPAGLQFGRLLLGTVLKWGVIGAGLVLAMTQGLVPEYVLGGAVVATLVQLIGMPWLLR